MFYMGTGEKLTDAGYTRTATVSGIDEAKIRAVVEVEARGDGFYSSGAVTCLYEPHIAYKYAPPAVRSKLQKENLAYAKWGAIKYPKSSFARIDRCAEIAGEELAAIATSWGLPQMMGFNHAACGYGTAVDMVKAFARSEENQLDAMMRFIASKPSMAKALRVGDWATFAKDYNGPGFAKNGYHTKLQAAHQRWVIELRRRAENAPPLDTSDQNVPDPAPKPQSVRSRIFAFFTKVFSGWGR